MNDKIRNQIITSALQLNLMTTTGWYYDGVAGPLVDSIAADTVSCEQLCAHSIREIEFLTVNGTGIGIW